MKEFLTDAEMAGLEKTQFKSRAPDFISDDEMKKLESGPSYDYSNISQVASDLVKTNVDALPMYAQTLGSVLSGGNPVVAGAAQAAGNSLKQGLYGVKELITGERPLSDELRLPTQDQVLAVASDAVKNFNEGATAEMGGQIAGKFVQNTAQAISNAAPGIKQTANRMAGRALGAERGTIKKFGMDKVEQAGAYALENDLLKGGFNSTDDLILKNNATKKKGGEMMGEVYSKIDDAGKSTFNPLEVAGKVDSELSPAYRTPINKSEVTQLENTLESILARGDKNIPLTKAQALKEEIGAVAFPKGKKPIDPTPKQQMALDAYAIINKSIDEATEKGAKEIGSEELSGVLKKGKALYSAATTADKLLVEKLARENGNKFIGLTDWGLLGTGGAAALATGGALTVPAVAAYGAKKYGEKFGAQQSALALNKVSKLLKDSPKLLAMSKEAPKMFEELVTKTTQHIFENKRNDEEKGQARWMSKGSQAMQESGFSKDKINELMKTKKGQSLLIRASDLKPGSKAMQTLIKEIGE